MILGRDRHIHASCFDEIDTAVSALRKPGDRPVVFNAHAFPLEIPPDAIVYNTENLRHTAKGVQFAGHDVWDFSYSNVWKYRREDGLKSLDHVPFGYHPTMERFERAPVQDIDVIFSGCMNDRRIAVMNALGGRGLKVCVVPAEMYGVDRDKLLARAKLALNMLFYPDGVFPALRVAHLVANHVPVLSEACPEGWNFVTTCTYENIVKDACELLLRHDLRERHEANAYACFLEKPMVLPS